MRISALITRLWGDIIAQPLALFVVGMVVFGLAVLAAVGLVVVGRRVEAALRRFVRECREDAAWRRFLRECREDEDAALREQARQLDAAADDPAVQLFRYQLAAFDSRDVDDWARAERRREDN